MIDPGWALPLARAQFAFTVSFHFLFPAFSIGLASFLAVLEGLWLKTGKGVYANLFRYWLKIFAVVFAMGVVSGIVMSYQFGTNWSVFSDKAGPVIGPLMAYEVLTAFILEAGFLGVMLFGMNKVGKGLHFTATLAVAIGTFISASPPARWSRLSRKGWRWARCCRGSPSRAGPMPAGGGNGSRPSAC
jgi:cytochrome d ubiquinol oxidase subunit I